MRVPFVKYHGLGNDFLVVDLRRDPSLAPALAARAAALCDRRFGVGGDGVFLLLPHPEAAAQIVIYNADGSRPEMCGNGIRCAARYLYERGGEAKAELPLLTDAGMIRCRVVLDEAGAPSSVVVRMGPPRLRPAEVPVIAAGESALDLDVEGFRLSAVSMGNPHAILFEGFTGEPLDAARRHGPVLEAHPRFPNKTNVEFVRQRGPRELDLAVYERGCGLTLACGTGACATAVAAVLTSRCPADEELRINLPGGPLWITVPADLSDVFMRGPAVEVFSGEVSLEAVGVAPVLL